MSLPSIPSPSGRQNIDDPLSPPRTPNDTEKHGKAPEEAPKTFSKKRQRSPEDDLSTSSANSGAGAAAQGEEASSAPCYKHRRLDPAETAELEQRRKDLSDVLANGDLTTVKKALDRHPGLLNLKHPQLDATLLQEALWLKQYDIAWWLLERGADPNIKGLGFYQDEFGSSEYGIGDAFSQQWTPWSDAAQKLIIIGAHVLGQTPLVHAASHGLTNWVELLISKNAIVNNTDGSITPLMGAVIAGDVALIDIFLQHGADPTLIADDGGMDDETAGSLAIRFGRADIFRILLGKVAEEKKIDFIKDSIKPALATKSDDNLWHFFEAIPEYFPAVLDARNGEGQPWLLGCALENGRADLVGWLAAQGFKYALNENNILWLADKGRKSPEIIVWLMTWAGEERWKLKFIQKCVAINLSSAPADPDDTEQVEINRWLIKTTNVHPFEYSDDQAIHCLFHMAVLCGCRDEVVEFLSKFPNSHFHFPNRKGMYPIELAASSGDNEIFSILLNRMVQKGFDAVAVIRDMYERAITKHRSPAIRMYFLKCLTEHAGDPRPKVFEKLCTAFDFQSLEFFLANEDEDFFAVPLNNHLIGLSSAQLFQLHDVVHHVSLFRHSLKDFVATPTWKGGVPADSISAKVARHVAKPADKFGKNFQRIAEEFGMVGAVMGHMLGAGKALCFMRSAMIGNVKDAHAMDQQLAGFLGLWMPATGAERRYQTPDKTPTDAGGFSTPTCWRLTRKIVAQVSDLYESSERQLAAWASQLIADLPGLCVACTAPETGKIDADRLRGRLLERGVFVQNAQRLVHLVTLAEAEARRMNDIAKASTATFSDRLMAAIGKMMRTDQDDALTQRSMTDTLLLFSTPGYQATHAPGGVTQEFSQQVDDLFIEALWGQMAALQKEFGLTLAVRDKDFDRLHKAFVDFREKFEENPFVNFTASFPAEAHDPSDETMEVDQHT
ncbi:MAG: ankyrin repeat domain-containing protein [Burkholderiaceae bacterium]|nr:ankyrin repeat domain-containing protein [Burkholderiaceae bacterium]